MTSYYISFPTFPSHLRSCTDYIFEVLLYPARLKYEDFDYCLERLIEIFRELEEDGLILNINGQNMKVFFVLARIVGDNLALNEILGFSTSFNAFKYCRVCKLNKNDAKNNIVPCSTDLRNYEEYEIDKLKNDYHETGIRRDCIFNTLLNFHCTENIVFDIMHDLYEGIVKHDVALILKAFIDDKSLKHIKLDKINTIKQNFNYGRIEIGNLSLPIQDNHLKNCCLKMSASEAKTFLHFLPLMIGNLIPTDNKYWKLLQNLINISDLVMLSNFNADLIEQLRESIHKYTESFHQTFKTKLKPKHHFLQHYMDCIEYNGPLRYMMTFSYETKNRIVKNYANVCNQRKNLPKTLFYKAAMRFNNLIRKHKDGFAEITTHEKTFPYDLNVFCKLDYFNYLDLDFLNNQPIFKCKKMIHKRTIYEIECFIIDDIFNPKKLMQIIDILYVNEEHYLITKLYTIEKYDEHLMSYKVGEFNGIYNLVMSNEIASLPLNLHKITTGTYFRVKAI